MTSTISNAESMTSTASSATAACTTAVPGKYGHVPPDACNSIYSYDPSFVAAILFTIMFGAVTAFHIYQAVRFRKTFCWVIIMGCIWETASFGLRTISTRHQTATLIYTISFLLVLLAPLLINAFDYMILGRMVHFYLPEQKLWKIRSIRFSRYFVWLDIVAFLVQLGGGVIVSGTNIKPKTFQLGIHIYMAGIGIQQGFILIFTVLAIIFHRRVYQLQAQGQFVQPGWKRLLITLYASLAFISIRIIYRLIEYARGNSPTNPLPYHEAYFYALDASPMFLAALIMCISHPGYFLKGPNSEFPKFTRKEKKAAKAAENDGRKDHDMLLDSEEGYGGMAGSQVELDHDVGSHDSHAGMPEYARVRGAPDESMPQRYEPYCGGYGQVENHTGGEAGRV